MLSKSSQEPSFPAHWYVFNGFILCTYFDKNTIAILFRKYKRDNPTLLEKIIMAEEAEEGDQQHGGWDSVNMPSEQAEDFTKHRMF